MESPQSICWAGAMNAPDRRGGTVGKVSLAQRHLCPPSRHCDSRPCLGRESRRFLETGSLHPPPAELRLFPPDPLETTQRRGLRPPPLDSTPGGVGAFCTGQRVAERNARGKEDSPFRWPPTALHPRLQIAAVNSFNCRCTAHSAGDYQIP